MVLGNKDGSFSNQRLDSIRTCDVKAYDLSQRLPLRRYGYAGRFFLTHQGAVLAEPVALLVETKLERNALYGHVVMQLVDCWW